MHTDAAAAERASRTLEADLVHAGLPRERAHLEVFAFQLGVANELMAGVRTELVDDADQAPRWSSTLLAALRAGVVRYRSAGKTTSLAVDSGFAEVSAEGVTVLTDRCINASDVDVAATRAELESAQRRFDAAQGSAETADLDEARRLVDWAAARLEAAKDAGKN